MTEPLFTVDGDEYYPSHWISSISLIALYDEVDRFKSHGYKMMGFPRMDITAGMLLHSVQMVRVEQ